MKLVICKLNPPFDGNCVIDMPIKKSLEYRYLCIDSKFSFCLLTSQATKKIDWRVY